MKNVCLSAKASNSKHTKNTNYKKNNNNINLLVEEIDTVYNIKDPSGTSNYNRNKMFLKLNVNNSILNFELDSGSPVTIINSIDKIKYFKNIKLQSSELQLVSYCDQKINLIGFIFVLVTLPESPDASITLKLYVVDSNRHQLLGREWMHALHIDWNKIFNNKMEISQLSSSRNNTTTTSTTTFDADKELQLLKAKYTNVFSQTMGKIKDLKARIILKDNARPVFIKSRSVPFSIKDAVEKELLDLEKNGIITKVNSSNWGTPIVPVRKANNTVRICADYKVTVNQNILVDKHPIPTIEELFATMAGGIKFSKIDLSKAYLQIEVHESDREINSYFKYS